MRFASKQSVESTEQNFADGEEMKFLAVPSQFFDVFEDLSHRRFRQRKAHERSGVIMCCE
jgi:hypothetical protein